MFHSTSYSCQVTLYNSLSSSVFYCLTPDMTEVQRKIFQELKSQERRSIELSAQEFSISMSSQVPVNATPIAIYTIKPPANISTIQLKIHARTNGAVTIIPDRQLGNITDEPGISHRDILVHCTAYQEPLPEHKIETPQEIPIGESNATDPVTTDQQPESIDDPVEVIEEGSVITSI